MKYALYSQRVLLPEGLTAATLFVEDERIERVVGGKVEREGYLLEDFGKNVIMPGLIDAHVHVNEPGRTEWEGFDTCTKSAAAGGITTLVDMPLNASPVTTNVDAFAVKLKSAKTKLHVNCGFWGGLIPESRKDLPVLLSSGVLGIKVFLIHSGIDEFPEVQESDLHHVLPLLKEKKLPLLVHCELESPHTGQLSFKETPTRYNAFLKSRPKSWEDKAIDLMIGLCRRYKTPVHIVHLSSANSLDIIERTKTEGYPITVETCPHYLFFEAENIPDGHTEYKCTPPIREKVNNDKLWEAVKEGLIDFIVSDHSPSLPSMKELKSGNLAKAWGGIAGLQFSLPAVWTRARDKGCSIEDICRLMSLNVARFLGLDYERGRIAQGYLADLLIWNPEKSFIVTEDIIHHRHKVTPYLGHRLTGVVLRTYISGHKVFDKGRYFELMKGKTIFH